MFAFINNKFTQLSVLFFLFGLSVFLRFDDLTADLNRESEWQTGHVLSTLSIWEKDGISQHYFSPVWTFNTDPDKKTNSLGGIKDKNNFTYYTSYPPFSFTLPYVVFKLAGVTASVTAIRVFSLVVHLLCAFLVFALIKLFWDSFLSALLAFCIYIFSSGNLWFHGNFYFADSLVQLFVVGMLYLFVLILQSPEKNVRLRCTTLGIVSFLGIYTEWLALFMAVFILVFLLAKIKRHKIYLLYAGGISAAIILSLSLTIIQYLEIAGFSELKTHSLNKYSSRSGFIEQTASNGLSISKKNAFSEIYNNYKRHYNYAGAFAMIGIGILAWYRFKKNDQAYLHSIAQNSLLVLTLSILTHHLLFFNFTAMHDISTLKMGLVFSLLPGLVGGLLFSQKFKTKKYLIMITVIMLVAFISLSVNRYNKVNLKANDIYFQERVGKLIAEYTSDEEMVFTNIGVSPVMMWYAQRNPVYARTEEECIKILESKHFSKGVFLKINPKDPSRFYEKIVLSTSSN